MLSQTLIGLKSHQSNHLSYCQYHRFERVRNLEDVFLVSSGLSINESRKNKSQ